MPITWQVEFQYTSGGAWADVTSLVQAHTLHRTMTKHNELKPTTNTLDFAMEFDATVVNNLLTNSDVEIRVHKDGSDWFTGTVRDNLRVRSRQQVETVQIECVDWSEKLKKRMKWTAALIDYDVYDNADPDNSILSYLLTQQGDSISVKSGTASIAKTIPYYVNVDAVDDVSYWDAIAELLFQFGYVWDFDESGNLTIYDFLPSSASSSATLDRSNTRESLQVERQRERYDGVEVRWWSLGFAEDVVVFRDTTGGGDGYDMQVAVADGDFFPNADGDTTYCEYRYGEYEVVHAASPALNYSPSTLTQNAFTNYFRRAEVELENATGAAVTVTLFQIKADVTYKEQEHIVRSEDYSAADDRLEIKAAHLFAAADAEKLSTGLKLYYSNADFKYECQSMVALEPGAVVTVADDNLGLSTLCWVLSREDRLLNNDTLIYRYKLEGAGAYSAETPTSTVHYSPPPRTESIEDLNINTGAVGTQPSTSPASGDVAAYVGERVTDEGVGLHIKEHDGEKWQTRGKMALRSGANVVDMFVSGFFKAGESVLSSPGLIWKERTAPFTSYITSVAYGASTLVAVGDSGQIARSTDNGASWGSLISNPFGSSFVGCIAYGDGVFVAGGDAGKLSRSTDYGATWSSLLTTPFGTGTIASVAYGNGVWVAVAATGKIARSTDGGASWGSLVSNSFTDVMWDIATDGKGTWIATASEEVAVSVDDGVTWGSVANPFGTGSGKYIYRIAYGDGVFVIAGQNGSSSSPKMMRSINNGGSWSDVSVPFSYVIDSLSFGDGVWVAGSIGEIARSVDGAITWGSGTYGDHAVSTPLGAGDMCTDSVLADDRLVLVGYDSGSVGIVITSDYLEAGAGIVEQGSNANGEYVIFSNGLQVCWGEHANSSHDYSAAGNIFMSGLFTHTFAKEFASTPVVLGTVDHGNIWAVFRGISATQYTARHYFYITLSSRTDPDQYIAIGLAS